MSEALDLHDMASKIARARFRLRALHPPSIPSVNTVCELLDDLFDITAAANRKLKNYPDCTSRGEKIALSAYCHASDPLGECISELAKVNATILDYHFRAGNIRMKHALIRGGSDGRDDLEAAWEEASEYVLSGCEVVDVFLKTLEGDLQRTATSLAPSANDPALRASNSRQDRPGLTSAVPPAPSVAVSRATKGR
ncbi:hypothetical protein ACFZAT_08705 [Streptomyces sp. NPDC008163]|uniref:hypothetical protein n=1 Tax=Streptomyces sp. NPDC008163 TaxID=3364818 RepID=UPI0036DFDC6F